MTTKKRTFNPGDAIAFTTGTGYYSGRSWYAGIVECQTPAPTGGPDRIEIIELTFGAGQQVPYWSDGERGIAYLPFIVRRHHGRIPNRKDRIQPARHGAFAIWEEFNRDQRHREYQASAEVRRAENISIGQNAIADELIWAASEGRGTLIDTLDKFIGMSSTNRPGALYSNYGGKVRDDYLAGVNQTR